MEANDINERMSVVQKSKLCFRCFRSMNKGHYVSICRSKLECAICAEKHPTLLHEHYQRSVAVLMSHQLHVHNVVVLSVVQLLLCHKQCPDHLVKVYALLDSYSQGTFISENVALL